MILEFSWDYKKLLWLPLLGFFLVLTLFAYFNIDHGLQNWLYLPLHEFPFQRSKGYELWLHDRIKIASNSLFWVVLVAALWPKKKLSWRYFRGPLIMAAITILVSVSAMRSLKDATGIYCPVQLQEYGGAIELHPKIALGHLLIINDGEGRCWPGGHSTAGFSWLAMFFAFFSMGRKRAAFITLGAALAYGHFLGLVQVVRGQHFLSHQFYTMAICWLIGLSLFSLWHFLAKQKT